MSNDAALPRTHSTLARRTSETVPLLPGVSSEMGQDQSNTNASPSTSPPRSLPSISAAEEDASRSHRPGSAPDSPTPSDRRETIWDAIRRQPGFDNLRDSVENFLPDWSVNELLLHIAEEHGDPETEQSTRRRFALRYLDDRDWDDLDNHSRAMLLSRMLRDEVDLPGFGLEAALTRWEEIYDDAMDAIEPDNPHAIVNDDEAESLMGRIQLFLHDYGITTFVAVVQEFYESQEHVDLLLSKILRINDEGESVVYEPSSTPEMVANYLYSWLAGAQFQMSASEERAKGSRPDWEDVSDFSDNDEGDDAEPGDEQRSIRSIWDALQREPLRWRRIYLRVLRHVHTFGVESAEGQLLFLDGMAEAREQWAQDGGLGQVITPERHDNPEARLAAIIADCLAIQEREQRGINLSAVPSQSPPSSGSAGTSSPSNASTSRRTPSSIASQNLDEDENSILQAQLEELREEHDTQLALNRALEDENDELREQVQEARQDHQHEDDEEEDEDETSHCPICDLALPKLPNAKVRETHMAFHRYEINRYRVNDRLEPYLQRRRSSPSPARSTTQQSEGPRETQESPASRADPPRRGTPNRKRKASTSSEELEDSDENAPRRVVRRRLDAVVISVGPPPAINSKTTRTAAVAATKGQRRHDSR